MDFSVIYYIKSSVVAFFSVNPMYSVNPMSVRVMHHCIVLSMVIYFFTFLESYHANTVVHDFNGHGVNGKHGFNGKKCYDGPFYVVNNGKIHV